MTQYLVAIHHPDDYDPSAEDEAMSRDIDALNDEMVAAGVRIFVGGLSPARSARSLRAQPDGKVLITDGPYLETKEHIGAVYVRPRLSSTGTLWAPASTLASAVRAGKRAVTRETLDTIYGWSRGFAG
jgi:hypothetical protein